MNVSTPKLGLLGHNISYSLSPMIHQFSAKLLGKNDPYSLYDIPESEVGAFLSQFSREGGIGLNVTTPYKNIVARLTRSSHSAVNTIRPIGHEQWETTSTDGIGFLRSLDYLNTEISQFSNLLILGSGGVTDALITTLTEIHPELTIHIFRRNKLRDQELKNLLKEESFINFHSFSRKSLERIFESTSNQSLLIQATSAPSYGEDLSDLVPALIQFKGVFVDLIYQNPSALLKYCLDKNIPACNGLPMLIGQALASQEFWWGVCAPFDQVFAHVIRQIRA